MLLKKDIEIDNCSVTVAYLQCPYCNVRYKSHVEDKTLAQLKKRFKVELAKLHAMMEMRENVKVLSKQQNHVKFAQGYVKAYAKKLNDKYLCRINL